VRACDGAEAVRVARATAPDVVIMAVRMPGLNGVEATCALVADGGLALRVIMLTTFDLDEYVYDALLAGTLAPWRRIWQIGALGGAD
jgi:DNA-binding NarL/FixJ family response regulator